MKKIFLTIIACAATIMASAQEATYQIVSERNTTVKANMEGHYLGMRKVHQITYEYPSTDVQGEAVTISGTVYIPQNIYSGQDPCDGVILFNHPTYSSLAETPSVAGDEIVHELLANPLQPNYIMVMSDYIGFGTSADKPFAFFCGDTNARNSLDGLLAAKQMLDDKNIAQGKYLFNIGFSQGGTEAMQVAKLRDMEYKDRGITFDKTFAGGGPLDLELLYTESVKAQRTDYAAGMVLLIAALQENYHLWADYSEVFQEPLASNMQNWILSKAYNTDEINSLIGQDSLKYIVQPQFLNIQSEEAMALRTKLKELSVAQGWTPDPEQKYFIEHSRHDNYVPIQSVRCIFSFMKQNGFTPSIVPGKTPLQTNTMVLKLSHLKSGVIWMLQTAAAVQIWPVLYYEDEQNRYYNDVVKDMNLLKAVKYLENAGIDLRKLVRPLDNGQDNGGEANSRAEAPSLFDALQQFANVLDKADITVLDLYEMLDDAGITLNDIIEVYNYLTTSPAAQEAPTATTPDDNMQTPMQLMDYYQQTLADWLLQNGLDVNYNSWGW